MKLIRSLIISSLMLTVIMITGCNETPTSNEIAGTNQQLSKTASTALLYIYNTSANSQTVNIYGVTSDWSESKVTSNNQPSVGPVEASFVTSVQNGWIPPVNITGLVNKWLNGTYDINRGLLLFCEGTNIERFDSREGTNKPYLVITYSDGTTETVVDTADAFITQQYPGINFGSNVYLWTGIENTYEKKSLLKFGNEPQEVSCETAFAYDGDNLTSTIGTCFLDYGFSRWGWSIYLPGPATYTFPVYAGAGQCDITKGTNVGTVTVVYSTDGTVAFTYNFLPGFSASEAHFYAGYTTVARDKKNKPTVAPGQYTITPNLSGGIYIIAHAVVCSSNWD